MSTGGVQVAIRREVRRLALSGASVPHILRTIQNALGGNRVTYHAIAVLHDVFDCPLHELKGVGEWVGFEHGNPGFSDAQIEERFGARLRDSVRSEEDVARREAARRA